LAANERIEQEAQDGGGESRQDDPKQHEQALTFRVQTGFLGIRQGC
jgi:hypothetical protein